MKKHTLILVLMILLGACQTVNEEEKAQRPIIYTSIYPIQWLTEELTKDFAIVCSIYPPGVDAHTYEPTLRDLITLSEGEGFIYLGKNMESFTEHLAQTLHSTDVHLIEVGQHKDLFSNATKEKDIDPHLWFDPRRMILMGQYILDNLEAIFPEQKETMLKNFKHLKQKLIDLDKTYSSLLEQKKDPTIIVSHAAYGYWEKRYGIKQIPISGKSPTDEPSQKTLTEMIQLAEQKEIDYVLFEQNSTNRLATILQQYIGAKGLELHNIETLVEADLQAGEDYLSLMKRNLQVLDEATK